MGDVSIIGLDLAKRVFQAHGAVAIALANKMARSVWAMLTKGEDYKDPVAVAA